MRPLGAPTHSGRRVHNTAGYTWRAPARYLVQTHLGDNVQKSGLAVGSFYVENEGLLWRELFLISALTIFNVKAQGPPRGAA